MDDDEDGGKGEVVVLALLICIFTVVMGIAFLTVWLFT